MSIVILDGYTTNPGDLDWWPLEKLGQLKIYDRTSPDQIIERIEDAEVILTNKTQITGDTMEAAVGLRYIGVMATGYNIVDIESAKRLGITVTNVIGYSTPSVVQHTFGLILELLNRTGEHSAEVRKGKWHDSEDFSYWNQSILELSGKVMGIVGFGNIGKAVAEVAKAFGMKVISYHKHPERDRTPGVEFVSMDQLLSDSDIISLHCPLREENYHLMGNDQFAQMKNSSLLINTARGGLVDHDALLEAIEAKKIAGAGLDVLEREPPEASIKIDNPKLVVTPHQAWASLESRKRLIEGLAENIKDFKAGTPKNVVA